MLGLGDEFFSGGERAPGYELLGERFVLFGGGDGVFGGRFGGGVGVLLDGGLAGLEFLLELDALVAGFVGEFLMEVVELVLVEAELGFCGVVAAGV